MSGRSITYQPALDGVRGVAVALVLLFHGGFAWASGGYVGVSVFFTLSGFLITTLLVDEHRRSGRVGLGRFYARRAKRLLPASLLCLVAVTALARAGAFGEQPGIRGDLLGALFQVANWTSIAGERSYTELLAQAAGRPSPLEHYWSLAIEEQFYVVWPLIAVVVLAWCGRRARVAAVGGLFAASAIAAPLIADRFGADVAYWSTPTRVGEILAGALLAVLLAAVGRPLPSWLAWLFVPGAAVVVWAATSWPASSGPAYRGWLPVVALASAACIAALQVRSPFRRALSWRPLVGLGVISYGVYLVHWPVFVALDEQRTGLGRLPLFAVRIGVTLVIAVLSYVLVERPIRRAEWPGARVATAAGASFAVAAAAILVVAPLPTDRFAAGLAEVPDHSAPAAPDGSLPPLVATTSTTAAASSPPPGTVPAQAIAVDPEGGPPKVIAAPPTTSVALVPQRPVRVVMTGDSTAWATADGVINWSHDHPDLATVSLIAGAGCGFVRSGTPVAELSDEIETTCTHLRDVLLPNEVARFRPDTVVLMVSFRDVDDRQWSAAEGPLTPFDGRFRERLLDDYVTLSRQLVSDGVSRVVWVKPPMTSVMWTGTAAPRGDPNRYVLYGHELEWVAAAVPEVRIIDLDAWFRASPLGDDPGARKDGVHWKPEVADRIATEFFGPAILAATLGP